MNHKNALSSSKSPTLLGGSRTKTANGGFGVGSAERLACYPKRESAIVRVEVERTACRSCPSSGRARSLSKLHRSAGRYEREG